jgi:hypothetical protein
MTLFASGSPREQLAGDVRDVVALYLRRVGNDDLAHRVALLPAPLILEAVVARRVLGYDGNGTRRRRPGRLDGADAEMHRMAAALVHDLKALAAAKKRRLGR